MKISIGADHRGFALKQGLIKALSGYMWLDVGPENNDRVDYPVYADRVVDDLQEGRADCGVLICGSGVGMSIAANRHRGIRAALCWNAEIATRAKSHDNANILVLPSDFITPDEAVTAIQEWLDTDFKGGRYAERLEMID